MYVGLGYHGQPYPSTPTSILIMTKPMEVAQEILDSMKLAYSDRHVFRVVDPQAFRHVNHQIMPRHKLNLSN